MGSIIPTIRKKISRKKFPDFLIIGAMKAGTTSLYHYLNNHPDLAPSLEKEPSYFSWRFGYGIKRYISALPKKTEVRNMLVYEASATYLHHPRAAQRIKSWLPDVKIIVLLRDPIERAISHYEFYADPNSLFGVKNPDQIESLDIQDAFRMDIQGEQSVWNKQYCQFGLYYSQLKPYLSLFDLSQIKLIDSYSLKNHLNDTLIDLTSFLEIDPDPFKQIAPSRERIDNSISVSPQKGADFHLFNASNKKKTVLNEQMMEIMTRFYRNDIEQLESVTSQRFSWSNKYL